MMTTAAPRLSVVIPTYRRPQLLARCLDAVLAQSFDARAYEVVIVDDGASADTEAVVRERQRTHAHPVLHYLATGGREGPAVARNRGWRAARGATIAFTDDDTVPNRNWLAEGVRGLHDDAVAVYGRIVVPTPDPPTDYERNTRGLEVAGFVTANCFVRHTALEAVGGFDERFKRAWREDADLYFSLMERVGPVVEAPGAVVVHPVRPARRYECLRQHANLIFDALLYKKHPALYRRVVRAAPPLDYYIAVGATVVALGALIGSAPALAAAAAIVALIPVVRLAWRRLRGTSRRLADRLEVLATSFAIPFVAIYWRLRGAARFKVIFF